VEAQICRKSTTLLHDSAMSAEIEELKTELETCKNFVAVLEADVKLLMKYRADHILRISEHVGDTTFDQDLARRSRDFVKRHILKRRD
jgi:hypothetical protein